MCSLGAPLEAKEDKITESPIRAYGSARAMWPPGIRTRAQDSALVSPALGQARVAESGKHGFPRRPVLRLPSSHFGYIWLLLSQVRAPLITGCAVGMSKEVMSSAPLGSMVPWETQRSRWTRDRVSAPSRGRARGVEGEESWRTLLLLKAMVRGAAAAGPGSWLEMQSPGLAQVCARESALGTSRFANRCCAGPSSVLRVRRWLGSGSASDVLGDLGEALPSP